MIGNELILVLPSYRFNKWNIHVVTKPNYTVKSLSIFTIAYKNSSNELYFVLIMSEIIYMRQENLSNGTVNITIIC